MVSDKQLEANRQNALKSTNGYKSRVRTRRLIITQRSVHSTPPQDQYSKARQEPERKRVHLNAMRTNRRRSNQRIPRIGLTFTAFCSRRALEGPKAGSISF